MKSLNTLIPTTIVVLASFASTGVVAQAATGGGKMGETKMEQSAAAVEMTDGEIRKVDKNSKKITIKHGAIRNLDMPPMTMVFHAKDAAMLDKVQKGDKVKFRAATDGSAMVVTEIQVSK